MTVGEIGDPLIGSLFLARVFSCFWRAGLLATVREPSESGRERPRPIKPDAMQIRQADERGMATILVARAVCRRTAGSWCIPWIPMSS